MILWLLGAHQPANAKLAVEAGATHLGLSFSQLEPRLPKKKPYVIADRFPAAVYLTMGSVARKSEDELTRLAAAYHDFIWAHHEDLAMVIEPDDQRLPYVPREEYRGLLDDKFVPVWLPQHGVTALDALAERYSTIALKAEDLRASPVLNARLRPLQARHGTRWHLLDGGRADEWMSGRFDSVATTAWLSPMRNGETVVWDGFRIQRYPARMKEQARKRHRTQFIAAGSDPGAILEGDYRETTRYTVKAYLALEEHLTQKKPATNPFLVGNNEVEDPEETTPGSELVPTHVDNRPFPVRNENRAPAQREAPHNLLPVLGITSKESIETGPDGKPMTVDRSLLLSSDTVLRACDTCFVAATCPAFNPGHECAFKLPVELKTTDQVYAAAVAMLEMQLQRASFMRFQEELNGGYADPATSTEMDRFFSMLDKLKSLQENRESLKITVEGRSQGGILASLLNRDTSAVRQLEEPINSDDIIDSFLVNDD